MRSLLTLTAALVAAFLLVACGTVAEPRPTFAPTETGVSRLAQLEQPQDDEDAENAEETAVTEETAGEEAAAVPTATPLPPTEAPTATPEPTEAPTQEATPEPTAAPAEESAAPVVEINGAVGDATFGEFWFSGEVSVVYNAVEWQCITCHNPNEPLPGSGPYLYGIANVAGERVEGLSAVEYLYEAIVEPNAHLAPPQVNPEGAELVWTEGVMPNNWESVLSDAQIADIIAYLLTLNQE